MIGYRWQDLSHKVACNISAERPVLDVNQLDISRVHLCLPCQSDNVKVASWSSKYLI
jgi:hypothetical protein